MADIPEDRIIPHPLFENWTAQEIEAHKKKLETRITAGADNGTHRDLISWWMIERKLAIAEIAKQNGNGARAGQEEFWPVPITLKEFLAQEIDEARWIWDNLIPYGEVAMLCGEPRSGKTTLALNLALAISREVPFLGRSTVKTHCLYIQIDNSKRDMRGLCDQLGMTDSDVNNIHVHVGKVPARATDWVLDMAVRFDSKFIVIDTLERFYEKADINSPEFAKAMYPMDLEIKRLGITPLYVHHATAKPPMGARIGSLFMGHTTVKGMTPYYLELSRIGESRFRILSSDLRSGNNLDGLYVKLDRKTGWSMPGGRLEDALMGEYSDRIIGMMKETKQATRAQIRELIQGKQHLVNMAIAKLVKDGTLERVDPLINTGRANHPEILTLAKQLTGDSWYDPH